MAGRNRRRAILRLLDAVKPCDNHIPRYRDAVMLQFIADSNRCGIIHANNGIRQFSSPDEGIHHILHRPKPIVAVTEHIL